MATHHLVWWTAVLLVWVPLRSLASTDKPPSIADDGAMAASMRRYRWLQEHGGPPIGRLDEDKYHYLDNGIIRVGVDLARGGSIGYLAPSDEPERNIINCHDMGREVQLSFYAPPNPYNPPTKAHPQGACDRLFEQQAWPWNPIGAGDIDGNHGEILHMSANTTYMRVVTRPLQWACHHVKCECSFEQQITIANTPGGIGVKVAATLVNHRTDNFTTAFHDQELPAVYTIGSLYHLKTYNGTAPWTGEPVVEYPTDPLNSPPWHPGRFPATEKWAALVDDDDWGLGVVNMVSEEFLGGFAGQPGHGGPHDDPTGYLAPVKEIALGPNTTYTFGFHLVLGSINDIRSYAKEVHRS